MNNERPNVIYFSKSLMYACVSVLLITISYLFYINPDYNHNLSEKNSLEKQKYENEKLDIIKENTEKKKKWTYDTLADVAINSEKYPIVVLRTGYKLIKVGESKSLIGWQYEVMNTSIKNRYNITINYKLTDSDEFIIKGSTETNSVLAKSYGVIRGTIEVANTDLNRLSGSTWTISLSPSWEQKEIKSKGKRYKRLKNIIKEKGPYWVEKTAENKFMGEISEKWRAIQKAYVKKEK